MRRRPTLPLAPAGPVIAALLLAGCNAAQEPDEAPTPTLTSQAVPTASADGRALTPGSWTIEETAGGASAVFGEAGSAPVLMMVCSRQTGVVTLSRAGTADGPQTFALSAAGQRAAVRMEPAENVVPVMQAEVDPTQPIFTAFADRTASIELSGPGAGTLLVPGASGISRVVQACS